MKHRQFFGTSLQDAMNRAVTIMGDEVVLLESEPVKMGFNNSEDNKLVRITVGVPKAEMQKNASPKKMNESLKSFNEMVKAYTSNQNPKKQLEKNRIESTAPWDVFNRLIRCGILVRDVDYFFDQVQINKDTKSRLSENEIIKAIKNEIIALVDRISEKASRLSPRITAFIGPTGVGKTSTIMKMALDPVLFRSKKIAIISMDHYRMAAKETLKIFSRISKIPFYTARNANELKRILRQLKNYDKVFIDTPGRSPFFPNYFHELKTMLSSDSAIDIHLVLSATSDIEDIFLSFGLLSLLQPSGIIMTKIDETARPGKLISIIKETGIPIDFITDGQNISGNLHPNNGAVLWNRIEQAL